MDTSALLAPLGKGVCLHITYSYSSKFNHAFFYYCIHLNVHSFIHCFRLRMTLAVNSRSWNVLLIFSCISFDVLYSVERACKMAFQKHCAISIDSFKNCATPFTSFNSATFFLISLLALPRSRFFAFMLNALISVGKSLSLHKNYEIQDLFHKVLYIAHHMHLGVASNAHVSTFILIKVS